MSMSDEERQEREARQRVRNLTAAMQHTNDLRHRPEPRWQRLRQHLEQEGIAIEDAAVGDKGTEDASLEFGIVVARGGRAFSFEFDFLRDEEGRSIEYEDARVSEWEELDEARRETYERELDTGRQVLDNDAPAGN